jgi:hypothetical protein
MPRSLKNGKPGFVFVFPAVNKHMPGHAKVSKQPLWDVMKAGADLVVLELYTVNASQNRSRRGEQDFPLAALNIHLEEIDARQPELIKEGHQT